MKYNIKNKVGIVVIIILALIPIIIWGNMYPLSERFYDTHSSLYSFGRIAGIIGMTLFSLTFVLTTRFKKLEDYFGGLDKVYKTHHLMGASAFVLLLFHPLLLITRYIPGNWTQAALFLLPGTVWAYNFGIIALSGMIILIVLTLYINMKYPNWKISHKFMGLVFAIACLHVFLVPSDVTASALLYRYMAAIASLGGVSFIYASFIRPRYMKKPVYVVEAISVIDDKHTSITLTPKGKPVSHNAGQFIFVRFLGNNRMFEQHPFTIASAPNKDGKLSFVIKSLGDYTENIKHIKIGTLAEIEGPYGRFNYRLDEEKKQVWIAGGVGITPFMSMLEEISNSGKLKHNIDLYYCVRNEKEAIVLEKLREFASMLNGKIRIIPYYSDQLGRLSVKEIDSISGIKDKAYFVCGPEGMMESLKKQLIMNGVSKRYIKMEDFNLK